MPQIQSQLIFAIPSGSRKNDQKIRFQNVKLFLGGEPFVNDIEVRRA